MNCHRYVYLCIVAVEAYAVNVSSILGVCKRRRCLEKPRNLDQLAEEDSNVGPWKIATAKNVPKKSKKSNCSQLTNFRFSVGFRY